MDEKYVKKYKTWIKGALGTLALLLFTNLVYIVFAFVKKKPEFWFNIEFSEFALKSSSLFEGYNGSWSLVVSGVVAVLFGLLGVGVCALAMKNTKFIPLCLAYSIIDSILLAYVNISNCFGDVNENCFISITAHLFVVIFLITGIIGHKKLTAVGVKYDGVI